MREYYALGVAKALNDAGIIKVANPDIAAQIAMGADPQELQTIADAKITEKDIESAAKIVQIMAQLKVMADNAGYTEAAQMAQGSQQPPIM